MTRCSTPVSLFVLGVPAVLLAACASSTRSPSPLPDIITKQEIEATGLNDAVAVVRRVRPRWLARVAQSECVIAYRDKERIIGFQSEWATLNVSTAGLIAIRYFAKGRPDPNGLIGSHGGCASVQFITR